MADNPGVLDRAALAQVFKDSRTLLAFEALQRLAFETNPADIAALKAAPYVVESADPELANARVLTGDTGLAVDVGTAGIIKLLLNVIDALGYTPAEDTEPYITFAGGTGLPLARILNGSTGVSVDLTTPGFANILINVPAALGYNPVDRAGDTMTGTLDVQDEVRCDSLRIDQAPTASVAAVTHSLPIDLNGTTYHLLISNVP